MLWDVSWEERDWATWTPEERARFLSPDAGPAPVRHLVLLAVLLTAVATLGFSEFHGFRFVHAQQAPQSPIVYGSGLAHWRGSSQQLTCTAMTTSSTGHQFCTSWSLIGPGQRAVQAEQLPSTPHCSAAQVDQEAGAWVCVDPAPNA
jgi:hypothetical protein